MSSEKQYEDQPPPYPDGSQPGPMQPQSLMPPGPVPAPQAAPAHQVNVMPGPVCVQSTVCYGEYSMAIQCPHCHNTVNTRITHQTGLLTWLVAGGIFLVGGFLGCCLIPFCVDFCLDVVHSCPNCNQQLGVYQRLH
ncbi:lipopolysaccharide-induced tumor necrosis factor-alpha factor homolog [Patiria miniata]|uniref:LITAF domain-containing protein n=1 Tax=Patiria miniata TaxID=46514 RepID=A0A913ZTM9_PATMI|nr:lipopolysaccharide-induced tumor necrosis factor-alpha factor homolog [Patiria miniata]